MQLPYIKIGDDLTQDAILASVEIVQELNQHWWCTIICRQTEDRRIPIEDFLGKSVKILTTDQEGAEHINFFGFILDVELTYELWGSYAAQITAVSDSYKLDLTARKEYYSVQTLEQIANTTAGHVGLAASVSAPSQKALTTSSMARPTSPF
jgi:type VI secretion system secreted protein VgrG